MLCRTEISSGLLKYWILNLVIIVCDPHWEMELTFYFTLPEYFQHKMQCLNRYLLHLFWHLMVYFNVYVRNNRWSYKRDGTLSQVHTFYEAVGYMISAQTDSVQQELLIEKYMMLPNQCWDSIISQASKVNWLSEHETNNVLHKSVNLYAYQ